MVYQDISSENSSPAPQKNTINHYRGALVLDRVLSVLIDFLIFSPLIGLMLSGVIRNLKTYLLYNENSNEATLLWFFIIGAVVLSSAILQVVLTTIFGGTPGQKFLSIEVKAMNPQGEFTLKPSIAQITLRIIFWWISFLTLGIVFVEILGHTKRRAIHDRVSETAVVSFGKYYDSGPLAVETKFISSWLQVFSTLVFCFLIVGMTKFYNSIRDGEYSQNQLIQKQNHCSDLDDQVYGEKRADQLLALLKSDEAKSGCVTSEAENLIWTSNHILNSWGYLLLSQMNDLGDHKEYVSKVCEGAQGSEPCLLSQFLSSQDQARGDLLRSKGLGTVSSRVLLLEEELSRKNYSSVFSLLNDLKSEKYLARYIEKVNVKAVWEVQQKLLSSVRSRNPASLDQIHKTDIEAVSEKDFQEILSEFKERYQIQ